MTEGRVVVVMGVSGSGKTTVGIVLAEHLGVPLLDADDLHSEAAIESMRRGVGITPQERDAWMGRVVAEVDRQRPVVLACSGLRRRHRDLLRKLGDVHLVLLDVAEEELARRLATRRGHFFSPGLLSDQLATLEPPGPDEAIQVLDGDTAPSELVAQIVAASS